MAFTEIDYDVRERIATITLNRPDKLNAFTGTMMRELIEAFDRADADDDVRVVLNETLVRQLATKICICMHTSSAVFYRP